jgi:hypothetical protein
VNPEVLRDVLHGENADERLSKIYSLQNQGFTDVGACLWAILADHRQQAILQSTSYFWFFEGSCGDPQAKRRL